MSVYKCKHCNDALSYIQQIRSLYCEKAICQRTKIQRYLVERKEKKRMLIMQVSSMGKDYVNTISAKRNKNALPADLAALVNNKSAHIALLPINTNELTALPESRKNKFLQHLETLFAEINKKTPLTTKRFTESLDHPLPDKENQLLAKACATCKGACCNLGKEHAFQDYPSLSYLLTKQLTQLNIEELTNLYKSCFPKISYRDACIFQGEKGCTLSSDLRSFTCKNFQCESLTNYHHDIINNNIELTISAAVDVDKEKIKRVNIFNENTFIKVEMKRKEK